jgi:hypothetical protein
MFRQALAKARGTPEPRVIRKLQMSRTTTRDCSATAANVYQVTLLRNRGRGLSLGAEIDRTVSASSSYTAEVVITGSLVAAISRTP